ncbi:PilX N-terminal domain-containing pilus assembly protein [Psychromonas sp.]|uniref:pilus assembly PilX family protein n=1 Tax=Psychromonas sp. TaxID=1884585 RepID=UPI0039E2E2B3
MKQKGFVLVSVLIITTITTMLAFSQLSENRLQERIAGNQRKEISARLAAEKGLFYAFEYIEAESDQLNTDILAGLKALPTDNKEYSFPSDLIDLTGTTFTLVSKGEVNGAFAYLKTTIEASDAIAGNFEDAVVGCESVKVWGAGSVDAFSIDAGGNRTIGLDANVSAIGGTDNITYNKDDAITGTTSEYFGECDPLVIADYEDEDGVDQKGEISKIADQVEGEPGHYDTGASAEFDGESYAGGAYPQTLTVLGEEKQVYVFDQLNVGSETITIDGDVTIYLTGDFTTKKSIFKLANSNSSLTILTAGKVSIGTNSDIFSDNFVTTDENETVRTPLTLYSSNDSTGNNSSAAVYLQGNGQVYMNLYAPVGEVNYQGNNGLFGAIRGKKVDITGKGGVHYDQGLADAGSGSEAETSYSSVYYYYPDE